MLYMPLIPDIHVHSSCQFVVSTSGDYSIHSGDPDRLVEWDRIEQVVRIVIVHVSVCPSICVYGCTRVYCGICMFLVFVSYVVLSFHSAVILSSDSLLSHLSIPTNSRFALTLLILTLLPSLSLSLSLSFCSLPAAAKITRCGHVYCWSCVLHYLALVSNLSL